MRQQDRTEPCVTLGAFISHYFPWMGFLVAGRKPWNQFAIDGISMRWSGGRWMVVVAALDTESFRRVVVFGSSETLYGALRNATTNVTAANWKTDKFRNVV